jgi:hypothetical protein
MEALRGFERESPVLAVAGVDLEGVLVAVDVECDAGPGAVESCDPGLGWGAPVVGAVDEVGVV